MDLAKKMDGFFPPALAQTLSAAGEAASARGWAAYLVGGAVRDMLLGRVCLDVDIAIEGEAITVANAISDGLRVVRHPRFGTATVKGKGWSLDLATSRRESYPHPGSLPVVFPAPIAEDLSRRDFTINALAVALSPPNRGEMVEPHQGRDDLSQGLLRVLHDNSFVDDPTRILRGLRYQARFGFRMEGHTLELLRRDNCHLKGISGHRLHQELDRILKEEVPEQALSLAIEEGVLNYLATPLNNKGWIDRAFARARSWGRTTPPLDLCLLAYHLSQDQAGALAERLSLPRTQAQAVMDTVRLRLDPPDASLPPSLLTAYLERFSSTAVATYTTLAGPPLSERLGLFLRCWRYVKPALGGNDIISLGVPSGPRMGEFLRRLRAARLDGEVRGRRQEEALVRRWVGEARPPTA
jgi:tRNA nucleotidyltransferase (CCA-adding enzyme)